MSRYHGRVYTTQVPEVEVVALCDTHKENLGRYQREVFDPIKKKPPTFADYRGMLSKVKMDAVLIVTPHSDHFEQVSASLDAGCHVLVEKPMVVKVEHARKLIKHAAKAERVLSVAFPGTFSPEFQYIRGLLKNGTLGDVIAADAFVAQAWKGATKGTWRQDPEAAGGGHAYDSGAHAFNALLYLTDLRPREVFAWTNNRGAPVDIMNDGVFADTTSCAKKVRLLTIGIGSPDAGRQTEGVDQLLLRAVSDDCHRGVSRGQ